MATLAAAAASSSHHLLLHRLILRRRPQTKQALTPIHTTPFPTSLRLFSSHAPPCYSLPQQLAVFDGDVVSVGNDDIESDSNETAQLLGVSVQNVGKIESENDEDNNSAIVADVDVDVVSSEGLRDSSYYGAAKAPPPSLSVKEKKDLASYAHSLGKKLKSQQVGKSGVTDTLVMALGETLEKRELLKLKIHGNCPGELDDVVKHLEKATGSVVVGQIGRTVILYRPSLTKLEAEEKKKQAQKVYLKRQSAYRESTQSRRPASVASLEPRQYGRGRRGPSRSGAL